MHVGARVECGQKLARIGFSGTATVYFHLHYQLMSRADFLSAEVLPFTFSDVRLARGDRAVAPALTGLETGTFIEA